MSNKKPKKEGEPKKDFPEAGEPKPLPEWAEDETVPFPDDENSEVIKLQVNDSLEGEIVDIVASTSWKGRSIYKIDDGSGVIKVILGTTMLDRQMSTKSIGNYVKIKRIHDKPTDKGNPFQQYRTYSKTVEQDAR